LGPFRSDFLPGTLLTIGKSRDRVAMASSVFLDGQSNVVSHAALPNVTLRLNPSLWGLVEGAGGLLCPIFPIGREEYIDAQVRL
jgi:hypothetical protein